HAGGHFHAFSGPGGRLGGLRPDGALVPAASPQPVDDCCAERGNHGGTERRHERRPDSRKPMSARRLTLIDGSAYLFRAYYGLPPLSTSDGRPTGAVRGVVAMLRKMLREDAPTHVAVVFDAPGKTFRDELYDAYKANRPSMPEELA